MPQFLALLIDVVICMIWEDQDSDKETHEKGIHDARHQKHYQEDFGKTSMDPEEV